MNTSDKQFMITFSAVLVILTAITITVFILAKVAGAQDIRGEKSQAKIKLSAERISPVGQVNLASAPVSAVAADPAGIVKVDKSASSVSVNTKDKGQQAYNGICQSCHAAGVGGAPIVGDASAWTARIKQGKQSLYNAVINGKGLMPAKGGNPALTDAEIKAAVDYMLKASK